MATSYLSPGVYVEEVDRGTKPIEGVGTSVAAFIGFTERAEEPGRNGSAPISLLNRATLVTNWNQYTTKFGGFVQGAYLPQAVYGYFANGGGRCYVISLSTLGTSDDPTRAQPAQATLPSVADPKSESLLIKARQGGPVGNAITVAVKYPTASAAQGDEQSKGESDTFALIVNRGGSEAERFEGLTFGGGDNNVETLVNTKSKLIQVQVARKTGKLAERRPAEGNYALQGGEVKALAVSGPQFEGDAARREGLGSLEAIDDVTMV